MITGYIVNPSKNYDIERRRNILQKICKAAGLKLSYLFEHSSRLELQKFLTKQRVNTPIVLFLHNSDMMDLRKHANKATWPNGVYAIFYGGEGVGATCAINNIKCLRANFPDEAKEDSYRFKLIVRALKGISSTANGERYCDIDINMSAVPEIMATWKALDILLQGALELKSKDKDVPQALFNDIKPDLVGIPGKYDDFANKYLEYLSISQKTRMRTLLLNSKFFAIHAALAGDAKIPKGLLSTSSIKKAHQTFQEIKDCVYANRTNC